MCVCVGGGGGEILGEFRQQKNPNIPELDRAPRHGGEKLEVPGGFKLNYITNLMACPKDFVHNIFAHGLGIRPHPKLGPLTVPT